MDPANRSECPAIAPLRFSPLIGGFAGTSFKHEHLPAILAEGKQRGFFEVHAENYMGAGGPPHRALEAVRRDPFAGIGKPEPLKWLGPGVWSRRITAEHRLVYRVEGEFIYLLQGRHHY